jgi:cytochrome b
VSLSLARVWDPWVRFVHWSVATLVFIDLLNEAGANAWHRYLGYAAGILVAARIGWGFFSPHSARLASMVESARQARRYLTSPTAREYYASYAGHNPLGALMAFTLWVLVLLTVITGWAQQLDALWGDESVQTMHAAAAYSLAVCAVVHVSGVLVTSVIHRTNLVKAMITGNKRRGSTPKHTASEEISNS